MDFRFDQDERDIALQARLTFTRDLPPSRLLETASAATRWRTVGEDGWLHAGRPEEEGGAGLSLAMVAAIGREAGRVLAGDGYVNNAVVLPALLSAAGALDTHLEHPGFLLADGRTEMLTGCPDLPNPWCFGTEPGLAAYCLTDEGSLLRFAPADWQLQPMGRVALAVGRVTIRDGAVPQATFPVAADPPLPAAQVAHAAGLVGLGEAALADTVEYAVQREQFGGPIGRFQAVKHALADVAMRLEVAWNAVLYAALQPDPASVSIALLQARSACDVASRAMIQFFGGIAMTWEHHAHLYLKTAQASRWRFGTDEAHAARAAGDLVLERLAS